VSLVSNPFQLITVVGKSRFSLFHSYWQREICKILDKSKTSPSCAYSFREVLDEAGVEYGHSFLDGFVPRPFIVDSLIKFWACSWIWHEGSRLDF
jgi:hypothetical protein